MINFVYKFAKKVLLDFSLLIEQTSAFCEQWFANLIKSVIELIAGPNQKASNYLLNCSRINLRELVEAVLANFKLNKSMHLPGLSESVDLLKLQQKYT